MIIYASLIRSADGTPLSATTDFNSDTDKVIQEGKHLVKLLSKQVVKYPKRVCIEAENLTIQ